MIPKLKNILLEKTITAYHGSNAPIKKFDRKYSSQGVFWFSEDKEKIIRGKSGALSFKYIITVKLNVKKIAGWKEYEPLSLGEIENEGFDSIKLDNDWVIFDNKDIKVTNIEKT